ncbi:hypothetical protein [Stratiformator vulcanicus]|uniref:DUF1772 domain-containing protein n=1 Tax=Stratiformator vulcanicus TaxID=2527980 RepID=A0A517R7I0_9PLAN|nr:hypothetical protein [Stratiformator vulcanicus]QDT39847.1 hypothetical protein Pan189_42590 [Stratiformator vulcanicus]
MHHLLLIHAAATWYLVGLIWTVQVVHYPLFGNVGVEKFVDYEREHTERISFVVIAPMLIELATAFLIAMPWLIGLELKRDQTVAWLGVGLVALIWLSTFVLQVPQHTKLGAGFDETAHRILVTTNWIRTLAWTLRGGIALWLLR